MKQLCSPNGTQTMQAQPRL